MPIDPENTSAIICHYNDAGFLLEQRWQGRYDTRKEYLSIDRKSGEMKTQHELDASLYQHKQFSAFLGVINFDGERFLLFCDQARIASTVDSLEIFQISSLFFLGYTQERVLKRRAERKGIYRKIREYYTLLKSGFYFSYKYNLTQAYRHQREGLADKFTWNRNLLGEMEQYGVGRGWQCPVIQGFVKSFEVFLEGSKFSYLLISRRSNKKGGTRYFDRGLNEEGFVANFVETEQIIKLDEFFVSDLQIRGSIPIFFEQVGLTTRTKVNRGYELTHQVYKKHISKITKQYSRVFLANLLSVGKSGERMLTQQLEAHVKSEINPNLKYFYYDFHHKVKGGHYEKVDEVIEELRAMKLNLRYYVYDSKREVALEQPHGVFRTNCLDCLDRTNFFQAKIALVTLEAILKEFGVCSRDLLRQMQSNDEDNDFIHNFRNIWADNGDAISFHYTGTGSTHTDITRDGKRGWLGNLKHKYKTVTRFYNQNFWDFEKMKLVQLLLGEQREKAKLTRLLKDREGEFSKRENCEVYIFSWKAPKKVPKSLLFFPNTPQLIVVSIQAMSEEEKWGQIILEAVDRDKYILVQEKKAYDNLLKIFALRELKKDITGVEHGKIKFTSLNNKCANFIRFSLNSTRMLFVSCQLEYGADFQASRIKNLRDIHEKAFQIEEVGLQKSEPILNDEVIFLFGNMNTNVSPVFRNDFSFFNNTAQITQQKSALVARMLQTDEFHAISENLLEYREYEQAEISFLPTYKYVGGAFDTERSGWPDRIWYSTENKISCSRYDVIEQLRGEHVPVIGTFQVEIVRVNDEKRDSVCEQIIEKENEGLQGQGEEEEREEEVKL